MSRDPSYVAGFQACGYWLAEQVERRLRVPTSGPEAGRLGSSHVSPIPSIAELRRYIRELTDYPPTAEDAEDPFEASPAQRWHRIRQESERLTQLGLPRGQVDAQQQLHIHSWCACCCVPCQKWNPFYPAMDARRRQLFKMLGRPQHPKKAQ